MKHNYHIIFNYGHVVQNSYVYSYGRTKDIRLSVEKDSAVFSYEMSKKKSISDFVETSDLLFRDAIKKFYLIHAVLYDRKPDLKKIIIQIDFFIYEMHDTEEQFPQVYSLLSTEPMHLPETWRTPEFINYLLNHTKSGAEQDRRFSAIEAFLASCSRTYELDRFTNLWTSMNAYYSYVAECSQNYIKETYHVTPEENFPVMAGTDAYCLNHLAKIISHNSLLGTFHTKEEIQTFRMIGDVLSVLTDEEVRNLYQYALQEIRNGSAGRNRLRAKYPSLQKIASHLGVDLFHLILLKFPYLCRCAFIHGKKPILLTTFKDEYEIRYLHTVNTILKIFLQNALTESFQPEIYGIDFIVEAYLSSIGNRDSKQSIKEILKNHKI